MADYIPYTQTKEYFQTKVKEGCEQINCGSSATGGDLVIFKQPLKYKNFTLHPSLSPMVNMIAFSSQLSR